jgi:hypothetical protein
MVASTLFFGTTQKMLTLRLPDSGMKANQVGYADDMQFENGGGDVYRASNAYHMEYAFDYGLYEATGVNGLDNFADFAAGLYGPPIVYFSDPMYYDVNLFPPNFAAPALAEQGWKSLGGDLYPVTYANTAANTTNQPYRTATFTVTGLGASNMPLPGYTQFIMPIPPGMTAWLGFSGSVTGTGAVRVESWLNGATTAAAAVNPTLLSATGTTRINTSVASTAANYLRIGISATGSGAGTVALTSAVAQLWPTGVTPTLTGNFQSGQGNNGCKFATDAREETYILRDDQGRNAHFKGLSFGLKEIVR